MLYFVQKEVSVGYHLVRGGDLCVDGIFQRRVGGRSAGGASAPTTHHLPGWGARL